MVVNNTFKCTETGRGSKRRKEGKEKMPGIAKEAKTTHLLMESLPPL